MKNAALCFILVLAIFSPNPVFGDYPYGYETEDFLFITLPVGGWNTRGSFSPRSVAMGETFFSSADGTSGYLNPAVLAVIKRPQFSLNYRRSENRYETSFTRLYHAWEIDPPFFDEFPTYRRKTDYLDSISLLLPFRGWTIAASYFLYQEFNIPRITNTPDLPPFTISESGEMHGLNVALSHRLTSSFSLGISASYVFGDIDHNESLYGDRTYEYDFGLKGLFIDLGAVFEPNEKWRIGLALRPQFTLDIKEGVEISRQPRSSNDYYRKQPLAAVGSVLYRPSDSFELTADVSFWGWSSSGSDFWLGYDALVTFFKNTLKLNLGAEYRIPLPFPAIKNLYLRAGYIYDPQPYNRVSWLEGNSLDCFCAGLGLSIGDLELGFSAKIRISPGKAGRFRANVFQAGVTYRL